MAIFEDSKKIMNKIKRSEQISNVHLYSDKVIQPEVISYHHIYRNCNPYDPEKINISIHSHSDLDSKTFYCWGDFWVKVYLEKAIERLFGDEVNINCNPDKADVTIYMFGAPFEQRNNYLSFYNPFSLNIVWHYSHPEKMDQYESKKYDYMFIASSKWLWKTKYWSTTCEIDPEPLYACTDLEPSEENPFNIKPDVLFIGNARGGNPQGRKSVAWLNELYRQYKFDWNVYLYGAKWEKREYQWSHNWLKGQYFEYEKLPSAYSSAKVNLIDGHDNMRNEGFVPAKVFDTIAGKGWIVMEYNDGVPELFGDSVLMFKTKNEMYEMIKYSLENQDKIKIQKELLYDMVKKYTYDEVAKRIINKIKQLI